MADYQGWPNKATWSMALHLSNDQATETYFRALAAEQQPRFPGDLLAEIVAETLDEEMERGGSSSLLRDMVALTLAEVAWPEVARLFLPEKGGPEA